MNSCNQLMFLQNINYRCLTRSQVWQFCVPQSPTFRNSLSPELRHFLRHFAADCYLIYLRYLLTYLVTPWSRVLLEKLTDFQLVKKFPAFYGTPFASARHLSLSWATSIQSIPQHPTSWRSILILSSHLRLGLASGLFPSGFPTKTLYTSLICPICATCPARHSSQYGHPNNIEWGVQIVKLFIM